MSKLSAACPRCRIAVAPDAATCRACGARLSLASRPAEAESRPPVWITTENYHALDVFARRHRTCTPAVGDFLLGELARAVVCAPDWIAPDVVTMNSRVTFAAGKGSPPETRVLVYPDRYEPTGQSLSVLSPFGAALIGLAAGSGMTVRDRQGDAVTVRVERILYQPEAMRRSPRPSA